MNNKKSQVFSLDFLFAISIFILILLGSFWTWNYAQERIQEIQNMEHLQLTTQNTINELIKQPGNPIDWYFYDNISNVSTFGLADQTLNSVNQEKINKIIMYGNSSYSQSREKLHLGRYNYFLIIGKNSTGILPPKTANVISMEDVILLKNGTITKIILRLWI